MARRELAGGKLNRRRSARRKLSPARLSPRDVLHVGSGGLRSRPLRVVLSALGIAIGIATMISVVGVSASSQEQLMRRLDRLGTDMLVASPGESMFSGEEVKLPKNAVGKVSLIDGVEEAGATGTVDASVRRNEKIPEEDSGGIAVQAASQELPKVVRAKIASGSWLNRATGRYPAVVLGHVAARRLGVGEAGQQVWLGDRYFTVIGVLDPLPLAPELERSALVGWDAAERLLGFDGHPTSVYERSTGDSVSDVRSLLAPTIDPESPQNVQVTDPSAKLQARAATEGAFSGLLLGLGGIALLVGGVGVANTMIISVLERRYEIGLRRSLGAARGQIRVQFVTESLLLSGLGGAVGIVLGAAATGVFAHLDGLPWVVPLWSVAGGFGATLVIGTLAGLYPAVRAARLSPTLALHAA
ncbi:MULTISPECIES: ABC transporter permease [unclassified Streptomyces]|uniref:ABC transporter permease n=1 Tax=unclassified Streptomyces TaxID=2593676 RepID=UPI002DD9B048|nr:MULTISPECIES: ABC transporter permease [unclassified Streptomyces]WSA91418.1 ABC transporter permease [Streptomyces sp. NBC_01795]WSB75742.1 ABC transporter permease [Streptomyces sp. NBC_01775]WSS15973.1 ABC transporter permease [Streptomyces sp. NBC_01186]WSS44791.1 ABC transporter permease [Streptomyces sp. NBC_01187]